MEDNHHDAQKENGVLEEEPNQLSLQNDQEDTSGPEDEDERDRSGFSEDENVSDTEPDVVVDAEVDQFADDSADEREVSQE